MLSTRPDRCHVGQHRAREREQAENIGSENRLDFLGARLFNSAQQTITGVVDEHIDAPEALDGRLGGRAGRRFLGDIERDGQQIRVIAQAFGD
jgi:hypothetical protein